MCEYFPKLKSSEANVKNEFGFSNYAAKTNLKNATGVDRSSLAKKADLANSESDVDFNKLKILDINKLKNVPTNLNNLKSKVDKLDVNKLVPVPVNLSKLSDVVKNDVVKKMYIMLRSKILNIRYLILLT